MTFFWTELNTPDGEQARRFYAATLGWTFRLVSESGYWLVFDGDDVIGGLYEMVGAEFADVPAHWFSYVAVDDVDASCALAEASGGSVLRLPVSIPKVGRIAILQDPTGSVIGCIKPDRARLGIAA